MNDDNNNNEEYKSLSEVIGDIRNGKATLTMLTKGFMALPTPIKIIIIVIFAIFFFFIIMMIVFIASTSFGNMEYSNSVSESNVSSEEAYKSKFESYWGNLCKSDGKCTPSQKREADKIVKSQQKFFDKFDKLSKNMTSHKKNILLATTFIGYDISEFTEEDGAFSLDGDDEYDPSMDYENDTIKKLKNKLEEGETSYYLWLENSDYLDKKTHLRSYYTDYAQGKTIGTDISTWDETDKVKVRDQIINDIKDLVDAYEEEAGYNDTLALASSTKYWWPIGSKDTTKENGKTYASGDPYPVSITSYFGNRKDPMNTGAIENHGGIDLAPGASAGEVNVIAAQSGTVIYVSDNCTSFGNKSCGGGYGNYVQIQHSDGMTTLYGHMHQNSITVKQGDSVSQGEVIGKVGSSGSSTGTHLHFEVRIGTDRGSRVDPLDYVSMDDPRPEGASSDLVSFITNMEGGPKSSNGEYVVICNSGDIPTVGHGVTLTYNYQRFEKFGYPLTTTNNYYNYCGKSIPVSIADNVYKDILSDYSYDVRSTLAASGITLNNTQIDALTSLRYNCGNINGFVDAYKKYGSTNSLCTNWWHNKALYDQGGNYLEGLHNRRIKECNLFVNGTYN